MDSLEFRHWLSGIEALTPEQRQQVLEALHGRSPAEVAAEAIESRIDPVERRCPHCAALGAVSRGQANGLQRFRCKGCGKTFNALTGTPLAGLRHRELWLEFAGCLRDGDTVRGTAAACGVAKTTAFRWRHRFLASATGGSPILSGIVEADEAFFLSSCKGERDLDRPARHRGGKATKRGLSNEQVPVLVAADRSGASVSAVLAELTSAEIKAVLEPVIAHDALLVTDGAVYYPKVAAELGINHEALNLSAGERVRGDLHIQTVNSRHERLKGFVRRFRGVASKYLPNYVRWFDMPDRAAFSTPQSWLDTIVNIPAPVV